MKLPLIIGLIAILTVAGTGMVVTDFTAYLGNAPETCNNCHPMDYVYEGWYHGAHQAWATCNDCHTPHELIPKYLVKAQSGYHHVTAFLFHEIPAAIRAKDSSQHIIQENCIRCHAETVESMLDSVMELDRSCFDCHRNVAHGERGISILPYQDKEKSK